MFRKQTQSKHPQSNQPSFRTLTSKQKISSPLKVINLQTSHRIGLRYYFGLKQDRAEPCTDIVFLIKLHAKAHVGNGFLLLFLCGQWRW